MKLFKKAVSLLLCSSIILGITGCDQNSPEKNTPTTTTEDDNPVNVSDIDLDIKDKDVDISGKVLKYVGGYDITIAGDIKPSYVYFKEKYGATIEVQTFPDADIMEKLSVMINGGKSPDLVDQRQNSFPYYIGTNTYMPLDDYIDLKSPEWADVASYIESYAINGKHYYYPWAYYVSPKFVIYNRAKFAELGLDDPKELYDQNNWTWDTMKKCMEEFVNGVKNEVPDAVGLYGTVGNSFINSTGTALVELKDGRLSSNLNNANIDRAQSFLENLKKQGLSKLYYGEGDYNNVSEPPIILGYAAFQACGDWVIANYAQKQRKDPDMDIFFVPFPKDPNADKYYHTLDTFAYLVPAGAPNPQASAIFINCVRLSKTDETLKETTKQSIMKQKKYTDEQYELWNYFQTVSNFDPADLVSDYAYNVDTQTCEDVVIKFCEDVPFVNNEDTQSWTVMKESMGPMLDNSISQINSSLDKAK